MPPSLRRVTAELMALRRQDPERDLTPHIRALLQDWPDDDALILRGELISELQRQHRFEEALVLLRAEIEREPGEPHHSLSLAEHYHYSDINLPESLIHVEYAMAKARVSGTFMYQALGVRARLAIEMQDWQLLEDTLTKLARYEHKPGKADVFPETDFLPRIPADAVADEILSSYRRRVEFLRSVKYSTLHGPKR